MGGVALILLKLGHIITGSDLLKNSTTKKLIKMGATIYFEHSEQNVYNIDFIVISSAIPLENKEVIFAKKQNIPILLRAEIIQLLMRFKLGVAISGTHGKTTTTAMIFDICIKSGLDPTCINGGLIKSINSYAQLGSSRYFIVEADESDASFLHLTPTIAIVTNIESDHMDYYNGNFEKLKKTFLFFLQKIPLYGIAIVCIDNHIINNFLSQIKCRIITYGFSKYADICITSYKQKNFLSYFILTIKNKLNLNIILNMPGKHNALNAAAAVAFAISQGIKHDDIILSLKNFQGTKRRFDFIGTFSIKKNNIYNRNIMIIDDYGHHPTELHENIKTIRISWPHKNLIMIFQPHRYTRTHHLYDDFIKVLCQVDILLILNVYSANEPYIPGADSLSLYNDIKKISKINAILIPDHDLILNTLIPNLNGDDIILLQGAGSIENIAYKIFTKNNKKVIK